MVESEPFPESAKLPEFVFPQLFFFGEGSQTLVQVNRFRLQASTSLHTLVFRTHFLQRGLVSEMKGGRVPLDSNVRTNGAKLLFIALDYTSTAKSATTTDRSL